MNTKLILKLNGNILLFDAISMLLPMIVAFIYKEQAGFAFLPAIAIILAVSIPLMFLKPKHNNLNAREGLITVASAWILISFAGGLPLFFSGEIPSIIDAFFESASGYTTTGATIISDVESLSHCMLFWRSFTHWLGGMGVLMFVMALAPLVGAYNMHLMRAESTGPKVEKIVPKANATAKVLYGIYIGLTLLQFLLLVLGKMPVFDAINTSFATAGTGGFGIKNDSLASYSTYIQAVVSAFMLLFSVSFNIYFLLIFRKFKAALKNEELRMFVIIVLSAITLIVLNNFSLFNTVGEAIHHTLFTVASIISTSGFATVDFNAWPEFSKTILVMLMFIGACAGSTGGGIKVSRILIFMKSFKKEIVSLIHPRSVTTISINGKKLEDETIKKTNSFLVFFVFIFTAAFLLISLDGFSFETNFTALAATINNIGPGLAGVGPLENFAKFSDLSKLVLTFVMICGRLELFPLIILLSPRTWKKY